MSEEFILKSKVEQIIEEGIVASGGLVDNFTSFPIVEYVCSTMFLKMTGLLEQKFKALTWTMATNNREYRRVFLQDKSFGEFSTYDSKQNAYKSLAAELTQDMSEFEIKHNNHYKESGIFIEKMFENTIFCSNLQRDFMSFKEIIGKLSIKNHIIKKESKTHSLIPNQNLKELFENLIKTRNKIAHNAYVNNLIKNNIPEIKLKNRVNENFFMCFFILLYVDKILNETYQIYKARIDRQ